MSWVAVAVAGGTAVAGYFGQQSANKQAGKAAKNQGIVDSTTTRNPYPGTEDYRGAGAEAAYQALFGQPSPGKGAYPVQGAPGGGGRGQAPPVPPGGTRRKDGRIINAQGKTIYIPPAPTKGKKKGGGGDGASAGTTAAPPPFEGMSQETADIRRELQALPEKNAGMYGAAEEYLTGTLGGVGTEGSTDRNAYRPEAAEAARAISDDPGLQEFINVLKGGATGGRGGGFGGSTIQRGYAQIPGGAAGGGVASGGGVVSGSGAGSATGTDAALRKLVAGEDAPGLAAATEAIKRQVGEERANAIRELRARAVGSSFYGGDYYKDLEQGAIAQGDQELADSLAAARFGAFQNALGLGTQYDLGMADIGARERASASAAAGAGADLASRERLAKLGLWSEALGMGQQGRTATAGALGNLASLTSDDLNQAVAGVNALGGSRRGDLAAAGDLSLGSDVARNQYLAARGNERVGMAGVNLGSRELAFDRERFYDPFARISAYGDALNAFYGGYGSETTRGRDTRATSPPAYGNPWGAAASGAALGGQIGSSFGGSYQQRGGSSVPTSGNRSRPASYDQGSEGWY